jgi:hypothetical protein
VFGGGVPGVRGVAGDHGAGHIDRVEQFLDLGDLGGRGRDTDLGDDDRLVVEHRGEQLHVGLGVTGTGAAYRLAVHRQAEAGLGIAGLLHHAAGTLCKPSADQQVRGVRVDVLQDPADRGAAGRPGIPVTGCRRTAAACSRTPGRSPARSPASR